MTWHPVDPVTVLIASLVAFLVASIVAYPVYKALIALKSRQIVSQFVPEHAAKQGTPTMGGIITGIGFLAGCAWMAVSLAPAAAALGGLPHFSVPILYVGFALIGFVDDFVVPRLLKGKRGLGWTQKLVLQLVFAILAVWLVGPNPSTAEIGVAVFLMLFFSNAYNFADGMDWLAGLILIGMVFGYAWLGIRSGTWGAAAYLIALASGSLPFLVLNKPKAKVFMGDVGALPIGAVVGLLVSAIAMPHLAPALREYGSTPDSTFVPNIDRVPGTIVGLCIVSLMMVAELVPVPLQILSVKLRHGKRLFTSTPIHHGYQKKGWKETRVVAVFVGWQIAFSVIGVAAAIAWSEAANRDQRRQSIEHVRQMGESLGAYREN